jgi:hypothetical protein
MAAFKNLLAIHVKPGDITVDGIVLDTQTEDGQTRIEHRHAIYLQSAESVVQIFGRVPAGVVEAVKNAMRGVQS